MMKSCNRLSIAVSLAFTCATIYPTPAPAQKKVPAHAVDEKSRALLSDSALLDLVQKRTFAYFWDFADPVSGMARERSNTTDYGHEVAAVGGTGFGLMAIIVATERGWIGRDTAARRLVKLINFLAKADSYHGLFPHWLNGSTGRTIPFGRKDDGADVVESSYLFQGLLCVRQYFNKDDRWENELRGKIGLLWSQAEWSWQQRDGGNIFYWHWSPNNGWAMNFELRGYNECLITYILAASSPTYAINPEVYHRCWAQSNHFFNGREYYGLKLPLGFDYGGPLFFSQYSFIGLDPHGLTDRYANYWMQNQNHTLINYRYCVENPKHFPGYGADCWGLTASDTWNGYNAFSPTNDEGTISPTAALCAFPYTPEYSMKALRHFYYDLGDSLFGVYGFKDAFNPGRHWYAGSYLAIDQGPVVSMIENYRSGLLWKLFMSCPEIHEGLKLLDFHSPYLDQKPETPR